MIMNGAELKAGWVTTCPFTRSHPGKMYFSLWTAEESRVILSIRHSKQRALRIRILRSTSIFWTSLRMAACYLPRRLLTGSTTTISRISTGTSPWMSLPCERSSKNTKNLAFCVRRKGAVKFCIGDRMIPPLTWTLGKTRLPFIRKQILSAW